MKRVYVVIKNQEQEQEVELSNYLKKYNEALRGLLERIKQVEKRQENTLRALNKTLEMLKEIK